MSLRYAIEYVRRRYVDGRNVLGVGRGKKSVRKRLTEIDAIVVYVRRKGDQYCARRRRLPSYVFDRDKDGRVNRRMRYPVDVRALGKVRFTCSGEKVLGQPARKGTTTICFDAEGADGRTRCYALSCSHVIGYLLGSTYPTTPEVQLIGPEGEVYQGETIAHTYVQGGVLRYDLAIAEIEDASDLPLRHVPKASQDLTRMRTSELPMDRTVRIAAAESGGVYEGVVAGWLDTLPVEYAVNGSLVMVEVASLYEVRGFAPEDGDSGGPVFVDDVVWGLVVARFDEGCLVHHLGNATTYLFGGLRWPHEDISVF
ncbi:hypothetical protein ACFL09_01090 [Planctomycetota bacterium]